MEGSSKKSWQVTAGKTLKDLDACKGSFKSKPTVVKSVVQSVAVKAAAKPASKSKKEFIYSHNSNGNKTATVLINIKKGLKRLSVSH